MALISGSPLYALPLKRGPTVFLFAFGLPFLFYSLVPLTDHDIWKCYCIVLSKPLLQGYTVHSKTYVILYCNHTLSQIKLPNSKWVQDFFLIQDFLRKKDISYPEQQNWVSQILKCDYASASPDFEKAFYDWGIIDRRMYIQTLGTTFPSTGHFEHFNQL